MIMNEQDSVVFNDQDSSHDINDMAPELPEAELYAAQSAAAEHDFQVFEQSRIISEHGYSLFPGKKFNRFAFNSDNAIQMPSHSVMKSNNSINTRIAANVSDTDSGDQSTGGDFLISGSRRKRTKFGGLLTNDTAQVEINQIFPPFTPFAEEAVVVNEPQDEGFNSSSSSDSPRSLPNAIRNGYANLTNGNVGGGVSSEDNDFLTAVVPSRMANDERIEFFSDEKPDPSAEEGIDTSTIGGFKTMIGSDRKVIPSYFKKGGSFRDLAELGFNPNAKTIDLSKRTPKKSKTPVSFDLSSPAKGAVRALFKSGPVKHSPVKPDKKKTDQKLKAKKSGKFGKPSPKTAKGLNRKGVKVSAKKLTTQQSKAIAAVKKRLQLSKKKKSSDVWCICRKPHGGRFMICCDKCNEWFHGSCVKVSLAEGKLMAKSGAEYICPKCKPKAPKVQPAKANISVKKSEEMQPVKLPDKTPGKSTNLDSNVSKQTQSTVKSRSAFSKMGLFDIGLPARKVVITRKAETKVTKPSEVNLGGDEKKDSFAMLLKRKKLEKAKNNVTLLKVSRRSSTVPVKKKVAPKSAPRPAVKKEEQPESSSDETPIRRTTRSQAEDRKPEKENDSKTGVDVKETLVNVMESKETVTKAEDLKTQEESITTTNKQEETKAAPKQLEAIGAKRKGSLKKGNPKKGAVPRKEIKSGSEASGQEESKTDSETDSPSSEKRILRRSSKIDAPEADISATPEPKSVEEKPVPKPSTSVENAIKLQPGGINKTKKRALLKATLIKNKSLLNKQLMQMKAALGIDKGDNKSDEKKEENDPELEDKSSVKDSKSRRKRPPDDDESQSGGSSGSAGPARGSRGAAGSAGPSTGSSQGGKSPRNRSGKKDDNSKSARRSSPRKKSDYSVLNTCRPLFASYELYEIANGFQTKNSDTISMISTIDFINEIEPLKYWTNDLDSVIQDTDSPVNLRNKSEQFQTNFGLTNNEFSTLCLCVQSYSNLTYFHKQLLSSIFSQVQIRMIALTCLLQFYLIQLKTSPQHSSPAFKSRSFINVYSSQYSEMLS